MAVRDRLLTSFDRAATLPHGPERRRLLTATVVGGGFSGVEVFGELLGLASALLKHYPEIGAEELAFHLVEARGRILPEVTDRPGEWVVRSLEKRGARVHLNAQLVSAKDGRLVLSDGSEYDSGLLVWTAGNAANPIVHNHTDLPVDARGLLMVRSDLRVGTESEVVADVWAAGDDASVPDLAAGRPDARTVPNAQHAVRQGKRLAKNVLASLRGRLLPRTMCTTVSAWWRHSGWAGASSNIGVWSSRDSRPGWCTAATTFWPYRAGSARHGCSPCG